MNIVEKIHREIDTAQDRLLNEAVSVIENTEIPEETKVESKAARLRRIGFTSSPVVKKASRLEKVRASKEKEIQLSKEKAELIRYYKKEYPFHKFLTEEELDRICDKYDLVYASVEKYIKDIPEKNLRDIETMKEIRERDMVESEYKVNNCKVTAEDYHMYLNRSAGVYSFQEIRKDGYFIAAPKSHFDLKGLTKKGKGFFKPEDPIVFKYVKGGILVVTKWGDEANDELLTNEIDN